MKPLITLSIILFSTVVFTQERYTGPIIDMHLHSYSLDSGGEFFNIPHPPTLRGESFMAVKTPEEQKAQTLNMMDKHNIVLGMVTNGQRWLDEDQDRILIGRTGLPIEDMRKLYSEGKLHVMAEMAPFYARKTADDPSLDAYFAFAEEKGIPAGVHILPGGPNDGIHLMPQMLGGMRAKNANPLQLESILVKYPNLKLYIMHGGWPYIEDVKSLLYMHSNLYVELAVLNWVFPETECHNYIKALVDAGFGDRIMYGSDQMTWPQVIDIGIETIQSADFLTTQQKADIFYNNAARFLGLSEETIKKHKSK